MTNATASCSPMMFLLMTPPTLRLPRETWRRVSSTLSSVVQAERELAAHDKVIRLPEAFGFHDLRHYLALLLISSGADIKTVQARMRHASARTTLDTYGTYGRTQTSPHVRRLVL